MIDLDIIIPVYNSKKTINGTLYSILYQNYKNIHVYLINDCDNNNYSDEVEFFSNFFDIKEYRMKKNGGPGAARQYGLQISHGKYVMFIDSDDYFIYPNTFKMLVDCIEQGYDMVISRLILQWGKELVPDDIIYGTLQGKIYRKDFIVNNHVIFNPARLLHEDGMFNQVFLKHGAKNIFVDISTYVRIDNGDSVTHHMSYDFQVEIEIILQMLWVLELSIKEKWDESELESTEVFLLNYMTQHTRTIPNRYLLDDARKKIQNYRRYVKDNRFLVLNFIDGLPSLDMKNKEYIFKTFIEGFNELYK